MLVKTDAVQRSRITYLVHFSQVLLLFLVHNNKNAGDRFANNATVTEFHNKLSFRVLGIIQNI